MKKKTKKAVHENVKKAKPPEEGKKAEPKLQMSLEKLQGILSAAGSFMKSVFRALHFTGIVFILPVHKEDAAETALAYGKMQAGVSGAIAFFQNFLNLKFKQVRILADFTGEIAAGPYFSCKISASPIIIGIAALYALVRLKDEHVV